MMARLKELEDENCVTQDNLWRIPITCEYGGPRLTWKECVECIDDITKNCEDARFLLTILVRLV
ncbi:hypothetical protein DYG64_03165 [Yersinia enterocolitica]|nr:hypothetical protein [Yersinia enterocolitica]